MSADPPAGRRPGRPPSLTRDDVARAALDEGVTNLSMPTVARRLGVGHSTLYRYVHDRDDLLVAAFDLALREFEWPPSDLPWRDLLVSFADAVWRFLQRYPGMAEASQVVPWMPKSALGVADEYVMRLRKAGLRQRDAVIAVDLTADLAIAAEIGVRRMSRVFETTRGRRSLRELYDNTVIEPAEPADRFDRRGWLDDKLAIMLDGFAARMGEPPAAVPPVQPAVAEVVPDRDAIAAAGRRIGRRGGLHAVSVHAVAEELGTTVACVHRAIGDRDGVVVAMLDAVATELTVPPPAEDPRTEILGLVMAAHAVLAADPWSIPALTVDGLAAPRVLPVVARLVAAFRAAGVAEAEISDATRIIWEHVYGAVLGQIGGDTFAARLAAAAELPVPAPNPARVRVGLEIVVDGLLTRLR